MIDGRMFTENIFTTFAQGHAQAKVPLLIGSNSLQALVWLFLPGGKLGDRADPLAGQPRPGARPDWVLKRIA